MRFAAVVEDAAHQNGGRTFDAHPSCPSVVGKLGLDSFEGGTINDGGMLAGMSFTPIDHLANVEAVLEKILPPATWS
jgi:hypothetical protein